MSLQWEPLEKIQHLNQLLTHGGQIEFLEDLALDRLLPLQLVLFLLLSEQIQDEV
jgi:hypothetical protein